MAEMRDQWDVERISRHQIFISIEDTLQLLCKITHKVVTLEQKSPVGFLASYVCHGRFPESMTKESGS